MSVQASSGSSPIRDLLFTAVEQNDRKQLKQLLSQADADPNCCNDHGLPLVIFAGHCRFHKGLKLILAHPRANPNKKDSDGFAALHYAAYKSDLTAIGILIENRANVNIRERNGYTPLHYAAKFGRDDVVDYFLRNPICGIHSRCGININAVSYKNKMTPLMIACDLGKYAMIRLLVDAGADVHRRNVDGYTAKGISMYKGFDRELNGLLPMDPFTEEFIRRKSLAHSSGIGDQSELESFRFPLEGGFSPFIHEKVLQHLLQFFPLCFGVFSFMDKFTIIDAMAYSGSSRSAIDVFEDIQNDKLTILQAGWVGHSIDLVFYQDYMAICNRGEGGYDGCNTIEVFKINPALVTKEIIDSIREQSYHSCEKASPYFYQVLPTQLAGPGALCGNQDALCKIMGEFAPKEINIGICSIAAAKAATRASMMFLKMVGKDEQDYRPLAEVLAEEAKNASLFGRLHELKQYLRFHFPDRFERRSQREKCPEDARLIKESFRKTSKHVARAKSKLKPAFIAELDQLARRYPSIVL